MEAVTEKPENRATLMFANSKKRSGILKNSAILVLNPGSIVS